MTYLRPCALKLAGVLAVALLGAASIVALLAPAADAAPKTVQGFFGGLAGTPFGQGAGEFIQPRDIAVYEGTDGDPSTDKLLTVEAQGNNMRVQRFDGYGNFERMWGKDIDGSQPGTGFEVCTVVASCRAPASAGGGSLKGEFNNPMGVVVDQQNGWVYVHDRDNRRVQKFDLAGNFILMFGKAVNATTGGDVCTQTSGDACGIGSVGTGAGEFASTSRQVRGLAVHPSSGDVFVADPGSSRVLQYQADGTFVRGWGFGVDTGAAQFQVCTTASTCQAGNAAGLANGQFSVDSPLGLAVDSQGVVYATDAASGVSANRILRFDSDLAPADPGPLFPDASGALLDQIAPTGAGGPLLATTTPANDLAIDGDGGGPDEESLMAVRDPDAPAADNTVVQALDIPTRPGELPADAVSVVDSHAFLPIPVADNGFTVNGVTGQIILTTSELSANPTVASYFPACDCFDTDVDLGPTTQVGIQGAFILSQSSDMEATIGAPANPASTSVELQGTVDPGEFVRYRFQVSADGSNWTNAGPVRYAGGSQPAAVSQTVTGLEPSTLYRVRLSLRRVTGISTAETFVSNEGLVLTDGVTPAVETLGSAHRTSASAQLRANVDPNGLATSYRFEYGPAGGSLTNRIPIPDALAGGGSSPSLVTQELVGLIPSTTYAYRVVATNASGTSSGERVTFTTARVTSHGPSGARAYELVSPADKLSGVGVGLWGGGTLGAAVGTGAAARQGDRYAASGYLGSVLVDGAAAYGQDWALAQRTPAGWVSRSPATHAPSNDQSYKLLYMTEASDDLSTVVWDTNGALLRPFPELASWPALSAQFVGDWAGRWEILAPTSLDQLATVDTSTPPTSSTLSADGSTVLATTGLSAGKSLVGGMAGPGDPGHPSWPDLVSGRLAYVDDLSAGLSDKFNGNGVYSNAGVCVGGTTLPRSIGPGVLEDRPCPAPDAGRDARLISDFGAVAQAGSSNALGNSTVNLISEDGARAFFLSPDPLASGVPAAGCTGTDDGTVCAPQLYVRQRNDDGSVTTRWISRAEDGLFGSQDAELTGPVRFAGATPDGDKVFFQTTSPLTRDDPNGTGVAAPPEGVTSGAASTNSWDLYMYDLPAGDDPAGGQLTRISAGPNGSGDCNVIVNPATLTEQIDGALRFVDDGGSRVYFTCQAPLPETLLPANGTITAPAGTPATTDAANIYAYGSGSATPTWRFVARLPRHGSVAGCATRGTNRAPVLGPASSDSQVGFAGGTHCVRGTSDGSFITFWTTARLTLDDPDSVSLDGYAYDADADELTRITAPQGGVGGSYPCGSTSDAAATPCHGDSGFRNPGALPPLDVATDPVVAGDRVAYFQTRSRLVPDDVDDAYDVYEWRNGDLEMLSTGNSSGGGGIGETGGAFYTGNDASGRNVYIATNDRLSWQDTDGVLDVYTARVGGGIRRPAPPTVCAVLAGRCQGPGSAPVSPTIAAPLDGSDDSVQGPRALVSVPPVGRKARQRAARRGVLTLRAGSNVSGQLNAVARGRIGRRSRIVARANAAVLGGDSVLLSLRLSNAARSMLKTGRRLRLTVQVDQSGARSRSITVDLVRGSGS